MMRPFERMVNSTVCTTTHNMFDLLIEQRLVLRVVLYFGTAHGLLARDNLYFYPHFGVDI